MITISNVLIRDEEKLDQVEKSLIPDVNQNIEQIELTHGTLEMPIGMIGFEYIKQYTIELLEGDILYRLVGEPGKNPVFYLINPYLIIPDYSLSMSDEEYEMLASPAFEDIVVFSILTLRDSMSNTTCNLLGPLVINNKDGIMLQIVNDSDDWGTKHLLSNGEKIIEFEIENHSSK